MYDELYNESTKADSKKRVRASQACVHCRKKKIKCDENRPDCTQCQEANVACEYTEPKKRGPRKGYVQLLEERLAQMERKLMGPGMPAVTTNQMSDEEEHSLSSASMQARSPIQLYENPAHSADLPPLDIVNHLVEMFFKYINSIFPLVHRGILKKAIQDGTVSRPLLFSVLAISARFSDNPAIRTNPPYLAGERFGEKALSLVDAQALQPNLQNIQFWGIMSCLEYGRASGSKSWIYGGLAVRFCQELGYYKEETMSAPIFADDGSIDTVAMALRRRVFWSCVSIDKLSSAGTHRPQCMERSDCDTNITNISESILLRDPTYHKNIDGKTITDDSLMNIVLHYMRCVESYGEVNRFMNRAKSNSASIVWPPIAEFRNLDKQLRIWQENLPESFQFNQKNLDYHRKFASGNFFNIWLNSHAVWCSSMMILHRGSLAFGDIKPNTVAEDLYRRIQNSVETCRMCVNSAMDIFTAMKDISGFNILPYMGYSAYVYATMLMTSTFSSTPESCKKSSRGLRILFDLIDGLRPYWPMCERLANATQELIGVHQKLYQGQGSYEYNTNEVALSYPTSKGTMQSLTSGSPQSSPAVPLSPIYTNNRAEAPALSALLTGNTFTPAQSQKSAYYMPSAPVFNAQQQQQTLYQQPNTALASTYSNWNRGNELDFNSLEFLYDTGLFGQVVFDVNNTTEAPTVNSNNAYSQPPIYRNNINPSTSQSYINTSLPLPLASSSSTTTPATSFQPMNIN